MGKITFTGQTIYKRSFVQSSKWKFNIVSFRSNLILFGCEGFSKFQCPSLKLENLDTAVYKMHKYLKLVLKLIRTLYQN